MKERWKLFFPHLFLLISSVFTEQSQICVTNANPAMLEQGDMFWWDNPDPLFVPTSVMKTPIPLTDDPAQEDLLQKYQERVDKQSQQNRVIKFCIGAGFLTTVDVDSTS